MKRVASIVAVLFCVCALTTGAMAERKAGKAGGKRKQATGKVTAISESSITVKARQGEVTFSIGERTRVTKIEKGSKDDLTSGARVRVEGAVSEDKSSVDAKRILVLPAGKGGARNGVFKHVASGELQKDGDKLSVKAGDQTVAINGDPEILKVVKASVADIKEGAFAQVFGTAGDGGYRAMMINLRPAKLGAGGKGGKKKK